EQQKQYVDIMASEIGSSPVAEYLRTLPQATRDALVEQERLAELQRLVNEEQDRNRGGAEKFAEAYQSVTGALDAATGAYSNWLSIQQGGEADLADVRLGVL